MMTPEKRKEFVVDELALSLRLSFETEDPEEGEERPTVEDGVRTYFDNHEEEWAPLRDWAENKGKFSELESLMPDELALRIHAYCREELGYDWLTTKRRFAYEYSV